MSEEMLVSYCSPTLSGLKTGSLFSCPCDSKKKMSGEISNFNQKLSKKGIRILPVRISGRRALIYVYRPEKLKQDFFLMRKCRRFQHIKGMTAQTKIVVSADWLKNCGRIQNFHMRLVYFQDIRRKMSRIYRNKGGVAASARDVGKYMGMNKQQ